MLSGCDATTPTAPELRRRRVLNYLLGTAFRAEALSRPRSTASTNQRSAPAAERKRKECGPARSASLWLALAVDRNEEEQEKRERKKAGKVQG